MPRFAVLVVLVALVAVQCSATTPRSQAKLTSLPGLTFQPNFDQYAGYITLTNTTKNVFYWFFPSQNSPTNDPFVLWLQGGPGCSDLGGGLFEENGPYYTQIADAASKSVNLISAAYSWNRVANVLYIEAPCGVGFSYSTAKSDYITSDNQTAIDNYVFLQNFFQIYPEWANNELWITGESYAGIYIPTLAYQILHNSSSPTLAANLKRGGLMLGNPVTGCDGSAFGGKDDSLFMDTQVNLFYWHGMVSRRDYDDWNKNQCNTANPPNILTCIGLHSTISRGVGTFVQPLRQFSDSAAKYDRKRPKTLEAAGAINPDCLYYSYCTGNVTMEFNTAANPDCFSTDDQIKAYLNDPVVQKAINAVPTYWRPCGGVQYDKNVGSIIPYLQDFFVSAPTMRILYYAGDIDIATVPFAGTQRCLETMSRPITSKWRPWLVGKEVAGYVEVYDTYTFATLKGAGHEAPAFQPASAYLLFTSFLKNKTLPSP